MRVTFSFALQIENSCRKYLYGGIKILFSHIEKSPRRTSDTRGSDVNAAALRRRQEDTDHREWLFFEQVVECGFRALNLIHVLRHVGRRLRPEVIAEIRLVFSTLLFRRGLLAVLGITHVVLDAHLAHVQFGAAFLADIETTQGQAEHRQRFAAAPAHQVM